LLLLSGQAQAGAAAYPFPQNQALAHPAHYPAYSNADVQYVYQEWLADQVTTAGAGGFRRVQRNGDVTLQPNSTVSEGIAYGMIIAVYMNDQSLFDDLWRYHNLHLNGNGLMNWYISADGTQVLGAGAASDADQDIAWALVMASHQWGTSPVLPQDYMYYAQDMIAKIWNHEVEKPSMVFRNGDGWGGAAVLNVSYFDPSMYRVFAQVSGNPGWYDVVDTSYQALFASLNAANGNATNGLVPAWSNLAGQPVVAFAGAPTHFQYDSCRTPFRIAKDWYYFGEPRAKQYLELINSFYVPIGADRITDGYDLNGDERPQYDTLGQGQTGQSGAFVGPAMVGAMDEPSQAAFVQLAYDRLKTNTLLIGGPYYDQSWTVMSLLMASGNYLNYHPTPTPTPTPDACQQARRINAGGGAQSGFSADQAFTAGGWGYVTGYAGQVGTSGGPVTGTSTPGLYLSERWANAGAEVRYDITAPNGAATVTLHWAETYYTAAGQRRMDVYIEGVRVEQNLDVFQAAGGRNVALTRTYNTTVAGGVLNLRFVSVTGEASIHAIQVTSGPLCTPTVSPTRTPNYSATPTPTRTPSFSPSPSFTVSPTRTASPTPYPTPDACGLVRRVNAGGGLFNGVGGLAWSADQAYTAGGWGHVAGFNGTVGTSAGPIAGTTDDALFMAERWGNPVRYRFDLPNGLYQVRVRLAESYFASAGQRNLSLSANGTTILNAVDLYTWAGGLNVARDHTFYVTVATGNLQLETWSSNNNGTFMAIEVLGLAGCTPTPTPAYSGTATPSRTPTPSSSPTRSATRTPTPTASPSSSPTASVTATPSRTGSGTPTRTPTSASTGTATPTAASSDTWTPTVTATSSASAMTTASPTHSATATAATSASPSPTGTLGVDSPTVSVTPSLTASSTATPTQTVAFSATVTPTGTQSFTPVPTDSSATVSPTTTSTATLTATPMSSATPSATGTASPTLTSTPTVPPLPSTTATPTLTSTPTVPPLPSTTATPTLTSTPTVPPLPSTTASSSGPLVIESHQAWPQPLKAPASGYISLKVQGPSDRVRVRLYTPAMALVEELDLPGSSQSGWIRVALPASLWQGRSAGLYYYSLIVERGDLQSPPVAPGRILWLR
jgi:hypothetical protein